jgi:hypothetical protein
VWRLRETAATLVPMREFRSWDLPAFGRPTMAMSRRFRCVGVESGGVVENGRRWHRMNDVCNDGEATSLLGTSAWLMLQRLRRKAIMVNVLCG